MSGTEPQSPPTPPETDSGRVPPYEPTYDHIKESGPDTGWMINQSDRDVVQVEE